MLTKPVTADLAGHLRRLHRFPILEAEEEARLARRWGANTLTAKLPTNFSRAVCGSSREVPLPRHRNEVPQVPQVHACQYLPDIDSHNPHIGPSRWQSQALAIGPLWRPLRKQAMSTDADQFAEPSVSLASSSGTIAVEDSNPMRTIRGFAFVLRCSGAAAMGYQLACSLGLHEALWAAISAVVVSQEYLHETRSSLAGRIFGTLLGIGITVAESQAASHAAVAIVVQMSIAVAICALVVRRFPTLRDVDLPDHSAEDPSVGADRPGALHRGSEVILGAIVGWIIHWVIEVVVDAFAKRRHASETNSENGRP
jgi:hypothetical protein